MKHNSLNPYSNGMKIELCLMSWLSWQKQSLNPYSNGMKIEQLLNPKKVWKKEVLILILME